MTQYPNYKVHMNTIGNVELSDPVYDSVKRGQIEPFLNVKSQVYLNINRARLRFVGARWIERNDSNFYFRITIPAFHAGDLKRGKNYRTVFTNQNTAISPNELMVLQKQNKLNFP